VLLLAAEPERAGRVRLGPLVRTRHH
jgi:hypothetical protein